MLVEKSIQINGIRNLAYHPIKKISILQAAGLVVTAEVIFMSPTCKQMANGESRKILDPGSTHPKMSSVPLSMPTIKHYISLLHFGRAMAMKIFFMCAKAP